MSWSTSTLARIAGTTVKTIRYYHDIGVLPEPERAANGYKQYRVQHLVTLLRVLRLKELGLSVRDVVRAGGDDGEAWAALQSLDAELEERISRWVAVREELAAVLRSPRHGPPPVDLPAGMLGLSGSVSDADRALLLVYSRIFDEETMAGIADSLRGHAKSPAEIAFDSLTSDADERRRQQLAEDLAVICTETDGSTGSGGPAVPHLDQDFVTARNVLGATLAQVYNHAQLDVLQRVSRALASRPDTA